MLPCKTLLLMSSVCSHGSWLNMRPYQVTLTGAAHWLSTGCLFGWTHPYWGQRQLQTNSACQLIVVQQDGELLTCTAQDNRLQLSRHARQQGSD